MPTLALSIPRPVALALAFGLIWATTIAAAAENRIPFDVPPGYARETLKQFAKQARREIVFPPLDAVRTNAVKGELTVREALDRLLAGTPLSVFEDQKTGGLVIRRRDDPNEQRAVPETGDRQGPGKKASANSDSGPRETITLSPFIVATERDTGWSANDTLTASRTRQALKDVPVNIDAVTADFMEDLGLFSADDTAQFIANVYAEPAMATEIEIQTNSFAFRGLKQNGNVSRNYFQYDVPSDTYNVERIDFGKGSNSLVFGAIEPGGQASVFTKRPLMSNFGTVYAGTNNEGGYRYQLDVNRRLRDGLALRANAVRREDRTFQDASRYKFNGETIALAWQPFRNTTLRLEKEWGNYDNTRGFAGLAVREQSARSLGFSSAGAWYTSDGNWFYQSSLPAADRAAANAPAGGSPSLLEGGFVDVLMRNAAGEAVGIRRVQGLPRHYNLRGSFDNLERPFDAHTLTLEQRFGEIGLELSYNRQNQTNSRNDGRFNSTISLDVNGRPFTDSTIDRKFFARYTDSYRATMVYNWQPFDWMRQVLICGGEYRATDSLQYRRIYYNVRRFENGQAAAVTSADQVRFRLYLDDPAFYSRDLFDRFQIHRLPVSSDFKPALLALNGTNAAGGSQWEEGRAAFAAASGNYFKGRLQSLFGVRWDWNRTYEFTSSRRTGPYNEEIAPPRRADAMPGEYVENPELHLSNTSYTAGLTLALGRSINLYGVYSNSYKFQGTRTFDSVPFGPITGVTKELGLKGSAWNDRLGFTLGLFEIDRRNVEYRWVPASFNADDVENLMNPNGIQPGDPRYVTSWHAQNQGTNVMAKESSRGVDLTLMTRPFKGLQARFTLGYASVESKPDFSSFRAFYDAAVKRGDESPALLAEAKEVLDSNDVATKPTGGRGAPWSASWILDYSFSREAWLALRGVRVGINGSWRDAYLFGVGNGQELYGGATHPVNGYIMRDQKIWGRQVRIRASVKNLIDLENKKVVKNGFTTMANGTNLYRFGYVMPAQYELSVSIKF